MKCVMCEKEFDPSFDFIEDLEACEALSFFMDDLDAICGDCAWTAIDKIHEYADSLRRN